MRVALGIHANIGVRCSAFIAARLLNRLINYEAAVERIFRHFDPFHIVTGGVGVSPVACAYRVDH